MFIREKKRFVLLLYWTPGLPGGVLSNHPCPWSACVSVCKYLKDCLLVFLKLCTKLWVNKVEKSGRAGILKEKS